MPHFQCSVVRVQDSGIVVVMEGNAFGLIPLCHACESTTEKIRKHYKVNTTLQCRVRISKLFCIHFHYLHPELNSEHIKMMA